MMFLHYLILLSLRLFLLFPLCFHVLLNQGLFPNKLVLFHLNLSLKLVINLFLVTLTFVLETLAPTHLHNPSQSLVFDLARNVPTKLKHYVICKSVVPFQPVTANVNFACQFVSQCVNLVKLVSRPEFLLTDIKKFVLK